MGRYKSNSRVETGTGEIFYASDDVRSSLARLRELHVDTLEASGEFWNWPSVNTITRSALARILFLSTVYDLILDVPGAICEFGSHYGSASAVLTNLRGLKEPLNHNRTLYVFDTFEGFPAVSECDGEAREGDFAVAPGQAETLHELLSLHESLCPSDHIVKHQIYKGDATRTTKTFLAEHPEALVALAILDMDLYEPTLAVLDAIAPRLVRGSVVVFDELCMPEFPGETIAMLETEFLKGSRLKRSPIMPHGAWTVVGD